MAKWIERINSSSKAEGVEIKKIENGYLAIVEEKTYAFTGPSALDNLKQAIQDQLTE